MAQIVSIETEDTCCFTVRRSVENSPPAGPGHAALHPLHIKVTKLHSLICCSIESSLCPETFSVLYPGRMAANPHRIGNAMLLPSTSSPQLPRQATRHCFSQSSPTQPKNNGMLKMHSR